MKRISMSTTGNKGIDEAFKEFLTSCKVKNLSASTIEYYGDCMAKFKMYNAPLTDTKNLSSRTVNDFILSLKDSENLNDVSVNTYLRGVRAIIYYWQKLGYCDSFKVQLIKADKVAKEAYSENELKLLLQKPDMKHFGEYRNWVVINFMLGTGTRLGELVNLKVSNVDLDEGIIRVKRGKARRERHIPISRTLVKVLTEYMTIRKYETPEDYMFCSSYGQKLKENALAHEIAKYNQRRGVNKTSCHLLRHTFAKDWILNGGDIFRIQRLLGHRDIVITKEYVEMFTTDLKKDFDEFNPLENISKQKGSYISMR